MLKRICSLAVYPIIGMIFHPAYSIANTIILSEDPKA